MMFSSCLNVTHFWHKKTKRFVQWLHKLHNDQILIIAGNKNTHWGIWPIWREKTPNWMLLESTAVQVRLNISHSTMHSLASLSFVQEHEKGKYEVKSSGGVSTYVVTICGTQCSHKASCIPQCTASECQYLRRHMISCTFWDYQEGHLCKHCH